jgi:hypothetical protein
MKKLLLATTALVALTAGSAGAADLEMKAPMMNATLATSWRGFYFGGAAGMGLLPRSLQILAR